jgi:hypothetical protein
MLGVKIPRHATASVGESDMTEIVSKPYKSDLVAVLVGGVAVLAVVLEVQRSRDSSKKYVWLHYLGKLYARLRCPVCLMVVATSESVAKWAEKPIDVGPGIRYQPIVLRPSKVPVVVSVEQAMESPELAVLSVLAHGRGDSETAYNIAKAACEGVGSLDDERVPVFIDLILGALGSVARKRMEKYMDTEAYEYRSSFARKYIAKGKAEGKAEGMASTLLRVLDMKMCRTSPQQRQQILACTDTQKLDDWLGIAMGLPAGAEFVGDQHEGC